jgi:hypothetical protein
MIVKNVEPIQLSDAVSALREQLDIAVQRQRAAVIAGDNQHLPPLAITEIIFEVEVVTTRDENLGGKLNYWIAGVDGSQTTQKGATQKVTLKLIPQKVVNPISGEEEDLTLGGAGRDVT